MRVSLNKIIKYLDIDRQIFSANNSIFLNGVANTSSAIKNQLTFIDKNRADKNLLFEKSKASVLIVDKTFLSA